uniref:Uncharacterized protein n=1 Tax=Neospora caninum (strain Liverpool) TaxID=572307 RepID=A0A0F7UB52_NEOCL|nr:TPA: hypothetical protein BN1204_017150 [Neospora caninum Liverpool]
MTPPNPLHGEKPFGRMGRPAERSTRFQFYCRDRSLDSEGDSSVAEGSCPATFGTGLGLVHVRGLEGRALSTGGSRTENSYSPANSPERRQAAHGATATFTTETSDGDTIETGGVARPCGNDEDLDSALSLSRLSTRINGVRTTPCIDKNDRSECFSFARGERRDNDPLCSLLQSPSPLVAALEGCIGEAGEFPVTPDSASDSPPTSTDGFEGLRFVKPRMCSSNPFSSSTEDSALTPEFDIDKFLARAQSVVDGNGDAPLSLHSEVFVGSYFREDKTSDLAVEPKITGQQQTNEKNLIRLHQDISVLEDMVEQTDRRLKGLGEIALKTEFSVFPLSVEHSVERTPQKDAEDFESVTRRVAKFSQADSSEADSYPATSLPTDKFSQTDFLPYPSRKLESRQEVGEEVAGGRQDKRDIGGDSTKTRMTLANLKSPRNSKRDRDSYPRAAWAFKGVESERLRLPGPDTRKGPGIFRVFPYTVPDGLREVPHCSDTAPRLPAEVLHNVEEDRQVPRGRGLSAPASSEGGKLTENPDTIRGAIFDPFRRPLLYGSQQRPHADPRLHPLICADGFVSSAARRSSAFENVAWVQPCSPGGSSDAAQGDGCCHRGDFLHSVAGESAASGQRCPAYPRGYSDSQEVRQRRFAEFETPRADSALQGCPREAPRDYARRLPSLPLTVGPTSDAGEGRKEVRSSSRSETWTQPRAVRSRFAETAPRWRNEENSESRHGVGFRAPAQMWTCSAYSTRPFGCEERSRASPHACAECWSETSSAASGLPPDGHWQAHETPLGDADGIRDLDRDNPSRHCSSEKAWVQPRGERAAHEACHPLKCPFYADPSAPQNTGEPLAAFRHSPVGVSRPWQRPGWGLRFEQDPRYDGRARCRRCVPRISGTAFLGQEPANHTSSARSNAESVAGLRVSTCSPWTSACGDSTSERKRCVQQSEDSPTVNSHRESTQAAGQANPRTPPHCGQREKHDVSSQVSPSSREVMAAGAPSCSRDDPLVKLRESACSPIPSVPPVLVDQKREPLNRPSTLCRSPAEKDSLLQHTADSAFGPSCSFQQSKNPRRSARDLRTVLNGTVLNDAATGTSPVSRGPMATGASPRPTEPTEHDRHGTFSVAGSATVPPAQRITPQDAFASSHVVDVPLDVQQILSRASAMERERIPSSAHRGNGGNTPAAGSRMETSATDGVQRPLEAHSALTPTTREVLEAAATCHQSDAPQSNETCKQIISTLNQAIQRIEGRTHPAQDSPLSPENSSSLIDSSNPLETANPRAVLDHRGLDAASLASSAASLSRHHLSLELKEVQEMLIKLMEPDVETPQKRCRKPAFDLSSPLNGDAEQATTCTERDGGASVHSSGCCHDRFSREEVCFSVPAVCMHTPTRALRRVATPTDGTDAKGCGRPIFFESPVKVERRPFARGGAQRDQDALLDSRERQDRGERDRPVPLARAATWALGETRTKSQEHDLSRPSSQRRSTARTVRRVRSMPIAPGPREANRGRLREALPQRMRPRDSVSVRRNAEQGDTPSIQVFSATAQRQEMVRWGPGEKRVKGCRRSSRPPRPNERKGKRKLFPANRS